jgi:N-acetylmuramic acid 6-phosphate etherase
LDKMPIEKAVALMLREEASVPRKLLRHVSQISQVVRRIVRALAAGGRLFYVGAGTSGRLGVLDASECPPTFRTPPELVQAIIAGGDEALRRSIEGAEDDFEAGATEVRTHEIRSGDVVIGIAASGTTPFVWGALGEARRRWAFTVLLAFNPHLQIPERLRPDLVITPDLGPEVLTGSTRLKAGTATKLLLNIFSTLTMVRNGKVISNLMVDLMPTNSKLQTRAIRIVRELSGMDEAQARQALKQSGWIIKSAVGRRPRKRSGPAR